MNLDNVKMRHQIIFLLKISNTYLLIYGVLTIFLVE